MVWLKLNEIVLEEGTDTGPAASAALFTFPFVSLQATPQVTSNVFVGTVVDCPTMRITTLAEVLSEFDTLAVQLCALPLFLRLRWLVQCSFPAKATDGETVTATLTEWESVPLVPVTTMTKLVPAGTPVKTVMNVEAELPAVDITTGLVEYVTVTPEGTLPLASVTLPVKPERLVTVRTSDPEDPAGIARDDAAVARLKSDCA